MQHFVNYMLHFVNDMLHFAKDLLRVISPMIGSNGAFHQSDQNMWKWIRITLDGSESKRLQLVPKRKSGRRDAKKSSESSSGDKRGQFWIVAQEKRGRVKVQSRVCFLHNFALDTLAWPDNSCSDNEM